VSLINIATPNDDLVLVKHCISKVIRRFCAKGCIEQFLSFSEISRAFVLVCFVNYVNSITESKNADDKHNDERFNLMNDFS
jgi:hypothetical protein